jgi:hypothetical protein
VTVKAVSLFNCFSSGKCQVAPNDLPPEIMETYCQSCGMPMHNPEVRGTEKNGSQSNEYCSYCYQNGTFTNRGITSKERSSQIISQMEKMNFDPKTKG